MKKFILFFSLLCLILSSCGGGGEKKETTTKELKKEARLSKTTQEGMMQVIQECSVAIHEALNFVEVTKESNSYKILFLAEDVDDDAILSLEEWFNSQVEKLVENGWRRMVLVKDFKTGSLVLNEMNFIKPQGLKVDVDNGVTLYSNYNSNKKTYQFAFTAE